MEKDIIYTKITDFEQASDSTDTDQVEHNLYFICKNTGSNMYVVVYKIEEDNINNAGSIEIF